MKAYFFPLWLCVCVFSSHCQLLMSSDEWNFHWFSGCAFECTCSVLSDCDPMDCSLPGSSVDGIFQARIDWSGLPFPTAGDLPNPRIKPESPALAGRFFTTVPPAEPVRAVLTVKLMILLWKMPTPTCLSVWILVGCWLQVMIFTRLIEMSHLGLNPVNYYCAHVIL